MSVENRNNERIQTVAEPTSSKNKKSRSTETFFRNTLKSNLELTSLADTKASILISVNGFILTVIITAFGFQIANENIIYSFISVILTSTVSIFLAVMAILPRYKNEIVQKRHLEDYNSALFFQDISSTEPTAYVTSVKKILKNNDATQTHIIKHLHILGSELQIKYLWLRRAYIVFIVGLSISVFFVVYAMLSESNYMTLV